VVPILVEVSAAMLKVVAQLMLSLVDSERRQYFGEHNDWLAKKVDAVLAEGLNPIYCCGETLEERESNKHFDVLKSQMKRSIISFKCRTNEQSALWPTNQFGP
jgi:triosephosphate isomerase